MKKTRIVILAIIAIALATTHSAFGTILTFDVEDNNSPVANGVAISDSYGSYVSGADTNKGNYLEGNGWTPAIEVNYLPAGTNDPVTGLNQAILSNGSPVNVVNPSFEDDVFAGIPNGWDGFANTNPIGIVRGSNAYPAFDQNNFLEITFGGAVFQNTGHALLANTIYELRVAIRTHPDWNAALAVLELKTGTNNQNELAKVILQPSEISSDWQLFQLLYETTGSDPIGDDLWVNLQGANSSDTATFFDAVELTAYPANSQSIRYGIETFTDPNSSNRTALLKAQDPIFAASATWDIIFTPPLNLAVTLNSFDLVDFGGAGDESGSWTLTQDSAGGAVIDSGNWTNLVGSSTMNVDMSSVGGAYAGPIVLRLVRTAGQGQNLAIDNVSFDQSAVNCDGVYQSGPGLPSDFYADCYVNLSDLATMSLLWGLNDPIDNYRENKVIYFGNDFQLPQNLQAQIAANGHLPFDGMALVTNFTHTFFITGLADPEFEKGILENIDYGRFTDNFMYMTASQKIDWFDDAIWAPDGEILSNIRAIAKLGAAANAKGILFDPEFVHWNATPPGESPWQVNLQAEFGAKTFSEFEAKVQERGVLVMDTIEEFMDAPVILSLFWLFPYLDGSNNVVYPPADDEFYGLLNAFMVGLLEGADPFTRIVDGDERSYFYIRAQEFLTAANNIRTKTPTIVPPALQQKYADQVMVGHAIYTDYIQGTLVPSGDNVYTHFTPAQRAMWMEHNMYWAMTSSDQYVWLFSQFASYLNDQTNVPAETIPAMQRAQNKVRGGKTLDFVDTVLFP
jgi:hypothetical protein